MFTSRHTPVRIALLTLLVLSVALAACGGGRTTPTSTKTPQPVGGTQPDTPTPRPPTATLPPPADTPTPQASDTPTSQPPTDTPEPLPSDTPTPELVARPANVNPLTGEVVDDLAVLQRRPLFVVINNDPPARSQHYGFPEADLVYEYIMEGRAVTRFTAVYLQGEAERIGPVRSARLINFHSTPQYGGALVASGAGQDVRWWLKHKMAAPYLDIDLDDPGNNVYSFSLGTDYRTRLQTSTQLLRQWLADWEEEMDPELPGFSFADARPDGQPRQSVTIDYPAEVTWTYDAGSERFLRSMNGQPHIDAASGEQISAANVIVQTVAHEPTDYVEDSLGSTSIRINTVGEGPVIVLRDGVAVAGTWRAGDSTMPEFLDASGNPTALKPGNTWIEVIEPGQDYTLQ